MKLNGRYYLDYNSTAPLSKKVTNHFSEISDLFANPSSNHSSGKAAMRTVKHTKKFLYSHFQIDNHHFDCLFHSGATEGLNHIIKGFSLNSFKIKEKGVIYYVKTDHSCIHSSLEFAEVMGLECRAVEVNQNGEFDKDEVVININKEASSVLFVFTWVNNENGVVHSLDIAKEIKDKTNARVVVDAVQSVGKIKDYKILYNTLDAYVFSGHKFGAFKGVGFSFINNDLLLPPLIAGGGQQNGLRSGTINSLGISSLKLALEELDSEYDPIEQRLGKEWFESKLKICIGASGSIVSSSAFSRNFNTIYFILNNIKANTSVMALDMAGFDVSNGSACSSGAVVASKVLLAMGYDENQAKSGIRLSFSPSFNKEKAQEVWSHFAPVIKRFL